MPLYLVRWPNLSFAFVNARSEKSLKIILDEIGDPGGCKYWVYRGPLFLDFDLDVDYEIADSDEARLAGKAKSIDGSRIAVGPRSKLSHSNDDSETGNAMLHAVTKRAFPSMAKYYKSLDRSEDLEEAADAAKVNAALQEELVLLAQHAWKRANVSRRTDPEGKMMQMLGLTENPYRSDDPEPVGSDPTPASKRTRRKPKARPGSGGPKR